MAEGELNYASVRFKANKVFPPDAKKEEETVYNEVQVQRKTTEAADTNAKKEEETVYDNAKEQTEITTQTADINRLLPDKKTNSKGRRYQQVAYCLGILCVIFLLVIIGVCVYIAIISHENELNQLKENETLLALNHNLTTLNNKLSSENENLRRDNNNLTVKFENLRQNYTVLESKITKLSVENQNLTSENLQLENERNNLTEQIQSMQTNELNVSRAQWSIDAYCPKPENQNRTCKSCQKGWLPSQSSCYAINNPDGVSDQKTWEEARENCRGNISDLVVIVNETEKTFISKNSWDSSGTKGYWIGLRAEDENWRWVDGSNLTNSSWIQQPATKDHCVISVQNEEWKSVSCGAKNRWICKKKALSV